MTARRLAFACVVAAVALAPSGAAAQSADTPTTTTTVWTPPTPPILSPVPPPSGPPTGTLPPAVDLPDEEGKPGFFDFAGRATRAINNWFRGLMEDALDPIFRVLGGSVFSTPDPTDSHTVRKMWAVSWGIANSIFVLFIVVAGAVAMGHETLQTRYTVKELLPRLLVGWVGANASLLLSGVAIRTANAVSRAFMSDGPEADGVNLILDVVLRAVFGGGIFTVLLGLGIVVLALCVLVTWVVRVATTVVLVGGAPLFLAAHALPQTEGMARLWWRALFGCLGVQVGHALIFTTAVQVYFDSGGIRGALFPGGSLMDLLVVGALLWLMLRLPSYAKHLVFSNRSNFVINQAKHYVVSQGVNAAKAGVAAL